MRRATQQRSEIVALVAAIVLVAQSLFAGWTAASEHQGPRLDAFGNPLCITGAGGQDDNPLQDHTQLPNCCALGCSMVAPLLPAPEGEGIGIARVPPALGAPLASRSGFLPLPHGHEPGRPRAPPLTA